MVRVKEALGWSAFWISLGVLFSTFIYFGYENHWLGLGMTVDTARFKPYLLDVEIKVGGKVLYRTPAI